MGIFIIYSCNFTHVKLQKVCPILCAFKSALTNTGYDRCNYERDHYHVTDFIRIKG